MPFTANFNFTEKHVLIVIALVLLFAYLAVRPPKIGVQV